MVAAFLEQHPEVDIQLRLGDRNVNLIEEHVDVALRIGTLPDSSHVATQVGLIRRVVCASPDYLHRFGTPRTPADLAAHRCITFDGLEAPSAWTFAGRGREKQHAPIRSRLTVSTADAAIAASVLGLGLTRVLSYQVGDALRDGRLIRVLADDEPPVGTSESDLPRAGAAADENSGLHRLRGRAHPRTLRGTRRCEASQERRIICEKGFANAGHLSSGSAAKAPAACSNYCHQMKTIHDLNAPPHVVGSVEAIIVRSSSRQPARRIAATVALAGIGLADDRLGKRGEAELSTRQVTLVQSEHLPVIARLARVDKVDPVELRRNLVVSGINLLALKNLRLNVGDALLEIVGPCQPCSRMEEAIGPGGYAAMRGHGGMTARVLVGGQIREGDPVRAVHSGAEASTP